MARIKSIPHRYVAPKRRLSRKSKKRLAMKERANKDNNSRKENTSTRICVDIPQEPSDTKNDSEPKQKETEST